MRKLLFALLLTTPAFAETCQKLTECLELGEKLLNVKFVYADDLFPKNVQLGRPLEMNKENAAVVLSEAMNMMGFAKIPLKGKGQWRVINLRDIRRDADLPTFNASKTDTPKLPDTLDPVRVIYRGVKGANMNKIIEDISPLLSRYGRAYPLREGVMVINDTAAHLRKLLPVLQSQDTPLTQAEKEAIALKEKREHELEVTRQKSGHRHDTDFPLKDEHDH